MKNLFTLKHLLMFVVLFFVGVVQAADLITQQVVVELDKAGTLPDKISYAEKYKITNLKIIGKVNGTDWKFLRDMAGRDFQGYQTSGKLSSLDLSEARIVKGGDMYNINYSTSDNKLSPEAFANLFNLTTLRLPSSITSIGSSAFWGCTSLTSLTIPSSVTFVGDEAFGGCYALTSLTIPFGVASIGDYAFVDCRSLTSLDIPSSVTSIGEHAFSGCQSLVSLDIPSSVTTIGESAFYGCANLVKLLIPSSVTSIGKGAFDWCVKLQSINIPFGVASIGSRTFGVCDLRSIVIPSSVASIYDSAFSGCGNLASVYACWEAPFAISSSVFGGVDKRKCILYVPMGTSQEYKSTEGWNEFENIVEYDVTGIDKVTTSTDTKELSRYSVNGQRLSAPAKGLNIVKYSDGSVKKVVVQ